MRILFVQQYPDLRSATFAKMLAAKGGKNDIFYLVSGPNSSAPKPFTAPFLHCHHSEDPYRLAEIAGRYDLLICRLPSGELTGICRSFSKPCLFDRCGHYEPPESLQTSSQHCLIHAIRDKHTTEGGGVLPTGILRSDLPHGPLFPGKAEAETPSVCVPLLFGTMEDQLSPWVIDAFAEAGITLRPIRIYGDNNFAWETVTDIITTLSFSSAALFPLGTDPSDGRLSLVYAAGLPVIVQEDIGASTEAMVTIRHGEVRSLFESARDMRIVQDVRDHAPLLDASASELFAVCEQLAHKSFNVQGATANDALVRFLGYPEQTVLEKEHEDTAEKLHLMSDGEINAALHAASLANEQYAFEIPSLPRSSVENLLMGKIRDSSWWLATLAEYFEDIHCSIDHECLRFDCSTKVQLLSWEKNTRLCSNWQTATQSRLTRYRGAWHVLTGGLPWKGRVLFIGSNDVCQKFYTANFFGADTVIHVDPNPANNPDVVAYGEDLSAFEDQSVDGVAYFGTPYVMNDPQQFMKEATRVLKPGGLLSGAFNGPAARWGGRPYVMGECKSSSEQWTFTPREAVGLHTKEMQITRLSRTDRCYMFANAVKRKLSA